MGETILMNLIHLFGFHLINLNGNRLNGFPTMCVCVCVRRVSFIRFGMPSNIHTHTPAMSHYQATNGARKPDEIE